MAIDDTMRRTYWPWMAFEDGLASGERAELIRTLMELGEFYAAGFLQEQDAPLYRRYALAVLCWAQNAPLMPWRGTRLYPWTQDRPAEHLDDPTCAWSLWDWHDANPVPRPVLRYHYSSPLFLDVAAYDRKCAGCRDHPRHGRALAAVKTFWDETFAPLPLFAGQWGGGYTHCTVNHERVMTEGLNGYRRRIERKLEQGGDDAQRSLWEAVNLVIDAAGVFQRRFIQRIESGGGDVDRRIALIKALEKVPFEPAGSFYEAMLALNFVFYFEGCDSPGRMDQYLWDFYRRDREAGLITDDFVTEVLKEFWRSMNGTGAWNVAIGGSQAADGRSAVNDLTYLILDSVKGLRRPNLALRVPKDAGDRLWDKAFDVIATGNGLPALNNDPMYVEALRDYDLGLREEDLREVSFGGCTETMIQGCSNVGSLAETVHMLAVLEKTLKASLGRADSFEAFVERYKRDLADEIRRTCDQVSVADELKARFCPQVIRTLLVDDCIDRGREFYHGGARYNWEVICLEGFANVVDSLFTLKELVYERKKISREVMREMLEANFEGYGRELAAIRRLPKYGQGNAAVDDVAADVAEFAFAELARPRAWRGSGRFMASCLMFNTYVARGQLVGATPDGRLARDPLADSFGAYQGRDLCGPTGLLNSVTSYAHKHAPGSLIINIRFAAEMVRDPRLRRKLQSLLETYFARGGMQIQVFVQDQEVLLDAIEHPERHGNLLIRIGGFSAYFVDLSLELKRTILERTAHC